MDDTSDLGWSTKKTAWDRLAWARARLGLNQTQAAEFLGMKRSAYIRYETEPGTASNPSKIQLRYEQARPWASKLKVRWEWLLEGRGTPFKVDPGDAVREALDGIAERDVIDTIVDVTNKMTRQAG
jgi:DNA-binding XRE family transcriptional regulator